jgi:hypothetical protein
MNALLIALLTLTIQINPSQATLRGSVTNATNNAPLSDAGVELTSASTGVRFTVATDADGTFTFKDVPPGEYRIAASHTGFMRGSYGQRGPAGNGLTITVKAGDALKDLGIPLVETGAVSGRILDRNRAPVPNVQVQVLRFMSMGPMRFVETVDAALTNDLGEYRLFWLPPDEYIVMALPIRGSLEDDLLKTDGSGNAIIERVRPAAGSLILSPSDRPPIPFFFRDSNDPGTATRLTVKAGENLRGIDITLQPVSTFTIKGKLTGVPSAPVGPGGRPPGFVESGIDVRLEPQKTPEIRYRDSMPNGLVSVDSKNATFEIRGVRPGSYSVLANAYGNEAKASVEVVAKDVEDVSISFVKGFDVPLKITVEGTEDPSLITRVIDSVELWLSVSERSGNYRSEQMLGSRSGTITVRNVVPGSYSVGWSITGNVPTYFKSVRFDGVNSRGQFRVDQTPTRPIEVVFGISSGVITGTVTNNKLEPASDVTVVAWGPQGSRFATSGPDGRFRITQVPPGDFNVYAWESIKLYSWQDPEVMRRDGAKGIPVHVADGSTVTVNPTSIPAPGK